MPRQVLISWVDGTVMYRRRADLLTDALIVTEEEEPIFYDWAADRSAELVKQRLRNGPAGYRVGAELGIRIASQFRGALTIVERAPVKVIRA